jgi:hypothetical protein
MKIASLIQDVVSPQETFSAGLLLLEVIVLECWGNTIQCSFIHKFLFVRQINVSRINRHISIFNDIDLIFRLLYDPVYKRV